MAALYLFLSPAVEIESPSTLMTGRIAPESKRIVAKLTALFSLDAFGGGFLTDALVAYWFFRRFGIAEGNLGLVFFVVHILNASSHLGAAWLARRIGLVNTMVFTHLPSSLFLMAVPLAPSFKWAVLLFITNLARNIFWAVGSASAGLLMQAVSFSAPLLVGGGAKVAYDLLLYKSFRKLEPPEEALRPSTSTNPAP